jgi:hypothetical protein
MSEYFELAKALAQLTEAVADYKEFVASSRSMQLAGEGLQKFPYYDPSEPEPSDEELERRSENRRAYRKPYDWMTELED